MTDYMKRLVFVDEEQKIKVNPLVWPFLIAITFYGLGFSFFGGFDFVASSSLFQSFYDVHQWLPQIWGATALVSGLSAFAMVLFRYNTYGGIAAMSGFLVWLFALITYVMGGYLLVALTVAGVNLYFWVYYYIRLRWYIRQKKRGILHDPN